jgi:thymidine phosphorylase
MELCARVLLETQKATDGQSARKILQSHIDSGRAYERFEQMIHMQHGDLKAKRVLGKPEPFLAQKRGFLSSIDGQKLGQAIIAMGGGRKKAGEPIDHSVGLRMERRLADRIEAGDELLVIYCDSDSKREEASRLISEAIRIEESPEAKFPLWQEFQPGA